MQIIVEHILISTINNQIDFNMGPLFNKTILKIGGFRSIARPAENTCLCYCFTGDVMSGTRLNSGLGTQAALACFFCNFYLYSHDLMMSLPKSGKRCWRLFQFLWIYLSQVSETDGYSPRFVQTKRAHFRDPPPSSQMVICEVHFTKDSYENALAVEMGFQTLKLLKVDAVPTIHRPESADKRGRTPMSAMMMNHQLP